MAIKTKKTVNNITDTCLEFLKKQSYPLQKSSKTTLAFSEKFKTQAPRAQSSLQKMFYKLKQDFITPQYNFEYSAPFLIRCKICQKQIQTSVPKEFLEAIESYLSEKTSFQFLPNQNNIKVQGYCKECQN